MRPRLAWRSRTCAAGLAFSEASYYLWRSKFGGMSVPEAKRLKELEAENTRLKKLLAEQMFENDVIKDALRKKW
ncbi:putative transposase [Fontimonas thermophila]|uniref:Putative transposase n=1 Tax=Fontimonas thermophila TaxID=1076937 RepID=A0A1I2JT35_9GAMM|nr:putative transposase [Fontimonas thermophila]